MADRRTFVSPALCGCELAITAAWASAPAADGKMYQHPSSSPGVDRQGKSRNTISAVEIVSKCAAHATWDQALSWNPFASMGGYMDLPTSPTPAEFLYLNHWRFTSLRQRLSVCDCEPFYVHDDDAKAVSALQHPQTRRCQHHHDDDDQHSRALKEERTKAAVEAAFAAQVVTTLTPEDKGMLAKLTALREGRPVDVAAIPDTLPAKQFVWSFDDRRALVVNTAHLTPKEVIDLKKALAAIPDLGAVTVG